MLHVINRLPHNKNRKANKEQAKRAKKRAHTINVILIFVILGCVIIRYIQNALLSAIEMRNNVGQQWRIHLKYENTEINQNGLTFWIMYSLNFISDDYRLHIGNCFHAHFFFIRLSESIRMASHQHSIAWLLNE